uniref:(California timema) hypothetical protein n=1 Tax=Timema californicum TaxID=61474 RepID=A0A7R9P5Q7_TIMCA|nr:unnamed protein product [Timema californicum]
MDENETPEESSEAKSDSKPEEVDEEDTSAFQALENEYKTVLEKIEKNDALASFTNEYKKLYDALCQVHCNEKRLMEKNRELQAQIAANASKVAAALKLTESDQETIRELKQEIEQAWKMVDAAHTREQNAQDTIDNLRQQVSRLSNDIEQKSRIGLDQSVQYGTLNKNKEGLMKERERLHSELIALNEKLRTVMEYQDTLERKNSSADLRLNELKQQLETQANEMAKEVHFKEKMGNEMDQMKSNLEAKAAELSSMEYQVKELQMTTNKLDTELKEQKIVNESLMRESKSLTERLQKLQQEYDTQVKNLETISHENNVKGAELKNKEDELTKLRNEANKTANMREHYLKRLRKSENRHSILEQDKQKLLTKMSTLERELDVMKKQADLDRRAYDNLLREKDILTRNVCKAEGQFHKLNFFCLALVTCKSSINGRINHDFCYVFLTQGAAQDNVNMLRLQEQVKNSLEQEIESYINESTKQRKIISSLEKERDRYISEYTEQNNKVQEAMEDIKLKQVSIFDYKKKLAEAMTKYKLQQNLFEMVRSDRNTFSKNLLEAEDEISELKQKLKVMGHQIEQMKEDITTKETQLMKEEFELELVVLDIPRVTMTALCETALQKTEKERENLREELQKLQQDVSELRQQIHDIQEEEKKLQKIIQQADEDRRRQKKEMEQLMNERDILGTQLVRRNDEQALLYEKIKILQSTLHKGEAQYDQRLEDIRLLKLEIKRLRQEKALLSRSMTNMTDLKQEVFHLERDLTKEKLKCRALEEELQNPLNVHRWRKLEGSDPDTYELLQKIQLLQKRLLAQSDAAIERENRLRESERLYINLRQLLARQPGPEVSIRLQRTQRALKDRGRKMKVNIKYLQLQDMLDE